MVLNFVSVVAAILLAVLFGWLFFRARHFKRGIYKWGGRLVGGVGALGFVLLAGLLGRGLFTIYSSQPVAALDIPVTGAAMSPTDQLARGEHLAVTLCAACHTTNGELPLSGGINMSDDVGMPMGDLFAPNLTPAGDVKDLSDSDIWRLFRHGVFPDGRLTVMPVSALQKLSDDDLNAVIAYLRSQPAVQYETPAYNPSPLLALAVGAGIFPMKLAPVTEAVSAPPKDATLEYGAYITSYSDCAACHGANLDGKVSPPLPTGPNLRVVKGWVADQFVSTMRTVVNPAGHELQPPMPWKSFAKLDDVELTAMWLYLKSLP